ncbi:MAG: esterase family protein [Sandaracinaceae bacterium]|nr:esterase family protein [Sandaracinaceae bacterium]
MKRSILLFLGALVGCGGAAPHRLDYGRVDSSAMGSEMTYSVYTPPGFTPDEQLPLVVFLHGGGDDPSSFDSAHIGQALDAAIVRGEVPRAVIVLPQGDLGFWANWYDGSRRYEDWVLDELVPLVARTHNTRACPEGCHVMGVSMGGAGTLRFALNRPEMWASVTMISAPILSTEQMVAFVQNPLFVPIIPTDRIWGPVSDLDRIRHDDPYLRWTSDADLGGTRLMLAWGDDDRGAIQETSAAFSRHLRERGIEHERLVYHGNHSWVSWTPVIQEALRRQL